jgi:hypothetical protein
VCFCRFFFIVSCLVVEADYTLAPGPILGVHFTFRSSTVAISSSCPRGGSLYRRPRLSLAFLFFLPEDNFLALALDSRTSQYFSCSAFGAISKTAREARR